MGRERRKREHALPRFPFHCYTNPYEDDRAARLAELRATTPPAVLAAIEEAAAAQFERDNTSRFGRALLRQYAMDDAVAAYFQLPSFAEWQAAQDPQEGNGDETP